MSFVAKYFRLLPAVVVVGTGLLALKGVDLARAAQAPASEYGDPDNTGLAPSDNGGAPASRDFASDDGASGSAAEVDVLSSLTRRRAELDARERALAMRENILSAGEGRVDQKIGALKTLQTQIQTLLTERDAKQDDQIKALIKAYGPDGMPPKKAAGIFNTMPDEVLIPIAKGMKPADLGGILQAMNPDAAQRLTVKLASLLKLPEPPPATVCPDPATPASTDITAPVTNPVVSLNPPVTTAALTNPTVTPLPLPPAPTPVAAPPPAPAPATTPKPQASTPPKPIAPPAQHPAKPVATPPAKPLATPPAKPTTAAAPAKPTTASATPPVKPTVAAAAPAKPASAPLPITAPAVTTAPASTPPAKPSTQAAAAPTTPPASAPPTPLAPAHGG